MRWKKRGAFLSLDSIMYMVVILVILAGGFGMLGYRHYAKYKDSIYRAQVDSIDTSLVKYGKYHRGIRDNIKIDSENDKVVAETPAVYPPTLDALKEDRNYGTGWFDANVIYEKDAQQDKLTNDKKKHPGLVHYEALKEDGNIASDSDVAYAFNLWVELSEGDDYYSRNSKKTRGTVLVPATDSDED